MDEPEDACEDSSRKGGLRHPEYHVPAMRDDLGADLDQLFLGPRQLGWLVHPDGSSSFASLERTPQTAARGSSVPWR